MSFYGLDQVVVPTAAFQKAAREILATHGQGRVLDPALSDTATSPTTAVGVLAGGALLTGAAISAFVAVYIFRHVAHEKDTFWKVVGYTGGVSGILATLSLFMGSVAAVTGAAAAMPAVQASPQGATVVPQ